MIDEQDLKRCPFCGSIADLEEVKLVTWRGGISKPVTKYTAHCVIKSCVGHHGRKYIDEQTAIDKWNMRVGEDLDEKIDKFREIINSALTAARQ